MNKEANWKTRKWVSEVAIIAGAILLAGLAVGGHWHRAAKPTAATAPGTALEVSARTAQSTFTPAARPRSISYASRSAPVPISVLSGPTAAAESSQAIPAESRPRAIATYAALPLMFEANDGQTDSRVKFLSRAPGYTLFLTDGEAVLSLAEGPPNALPAHAGQRSPAPAIPRFAQALAPKRARIVRLKFVDSSTPAAIVGRGRLPGISNYFLGNDPKQWHTNVPNYSAVQYRGIYSGVDAVFHGDNRQLEVDFDVAPGTDPRAIALEVEGAQRMRLNPKGDVVLRIDGKRDLLLGKPHVYQESPQGRREVASNFVLRGVNRIGFALGSYDHSQPLVIDPTLAYSTYLGGSVEDFPFAIAADSSGSAYIAGQAFSPNFPVTPGAYQTSCTQTGKTTCTPGTAYISKLTPDGSGLVYSTFLNGHTGEDGAWGIVVDASGAAYVLGNEVGELDFPTTTGAIQGACNIAANLQPEVFVAKLDPTGSSLVYSTCLQNPEVNSSNNFSQGSSFPGGIGVDGSGDAYVTGYTDLPQSFPTTQGSFQPTCQANGTQGCAVSEDSFVVKISPTGQTLLYSTFISKGQTGSNVTTSGIAVDSLGNAYVIGFDLNSNAVLTTGSSLMPTCPSLGCGGFVLKINGDATALVYSTFLGGSNYSTPTAIAVDQNGAAYVTGFTQSTDFPVTLGVLQYYFTPLGATTTNLTDGFVVKVGDLGDVYEYATFIGGNSLTTEGTGIALDAEGDAYVTGVTHQGYPTTPDAFQATIPGGNPYQQAFLSKLDPIGATLLYSTLLAGTNGTTTGIADTNGQSYLTTDPSGNAYLTGQTTSTNFPTTGDAYLTQSPLAGGSQTATGFVAKFAFPAPVSLTISPGTIPSGTEGVAYSPVTFTVTGGTGTVTFAVTSGALPSGLTLTSAGVLSGTPTQTGTFSFTVTATDTNSDTGSQAYTLTIRAACSTITVAPSTLPAGTAGTAYSAVTFTETGGVGTITYSESGTLPTGMTFAAGVLSGTPTQAGSFPITVTATDANGCTGSVSPTLMISPSAPPPLIPTPVLFPSALIFPRQYNGTPSDTLGVLYTNAGSSLLTLNNLQIVGPNAGDFSLVTGGATGSVCTTNTLLNENASTPPLPAASASALSAILSSVTSQLANDTTNTIAVLNASIQQALNASDNLENDVSGQQAQSTSGQFQTRIEATPAVAPRIHFPSSASRNLQRGIWPAQASGGGAGWGNTGNTALEVAALDPATAGAILAGVAMARAGDANATANEAIIAANAATAAANAANAAAADATTTADATASAANGVLFVALCDQESEISGMYGLWTVSLDFGNQTEGTSANQYTGFLYGCPTFSENSSGIPIYSATSISSITITPTNSGTPASDFSETNNCPSTAPPGTSCVITVTFTPSTTSSESAALTVNGQTDRLNGTGVPPVSPVCAGANALTATPNPLNFPSPTVGVPEMQSLTVTNATCSPVNITSVNVTGTNAGDFTTASACPASLSASQTCTIIVTFIPSLTAAQPESATLNVTGAAGGAGALSVPLTGNATAPYAQYSAAEVDFGNQQPGATSAPMTLNLANNAASATGPLVIYNAAITSFSSYPSTLACTIGSVSTTYTTGSAIPFPLILNPGDSCTWTITYTNSSPAALQSGLLSVFDNAISSSLPSESTATLLGNSTGATYLQQVCLAPASGGCSPIPTPAEIAATGIGSTISDTNLDVTTLLLNLDFLAGQSVQSASAVAQAAVAAAQFATARASAETNVSTFNGLSSPQGACSIGVQFTPTAAGTRNATLEIFDNSPAGFEVIPLTGTGTAPSPASVFSFSAGTLFFQPQLLGGSGNSQALTLTNNGTAPATPSGLSVTGDPPGDPTDFSLTNNCTQPVAPGGTCTVQVTFTPLQTGTRFAQLITTDANGNVTQLAGLIGSGTAVTVSPGTESFASQTVGTTSNTNKTIVVTNVATNTQPLTISSITLVGDGTTAAAPGDFAITSASTCNTSTPLAVGGTCNIVVSFTPSAVGARDAALLINDNGGASPHFATLTGTGAEITGPVPTNITLSSSNTSAIVNTSVTITATVTSTTPGTPTGSVTFFNGSTQLGTGTLNAGTATYTTSSLAGGAYQITATYSGDTNFATSTSSALTQNIQDYLINANPASLTLKQGQSGTVVLTVTFLGGLSQTITPSCSGLPEYSSCSFNLGTIPPPANGSTGTTTLTFNTDVAAAQWFPHPPPPSGWRTMRFASLAAMSGFALALVMLLLGFAQSKRTGVHGPLRGAVLCAVVLCGIACIIAGCSGTRSPSQNLTPTGTTQVTIGFTGGRITHTVSLSITINP